MMKAEADKVIPVKDILELRKKQMLVVNAEYQRGAVWTSAQKKKLVDSVLRGYPLPLIYLHLIKQEAGNLVSQRYEVIDGKPGLARYPGHEFFGVLMKANRAKDRGKFRQYAAQVAMQYLTKRRTKGEHLRDINAEAMDDFYYENLDFDADSPDAERLCE